MQKLGEGQERQRLSLQKYMNFNLASIGEAGVLDARAAVFGAAVAALPEAPGAAQTAAALSALLEDAKVLLDQAFNLEHVPAQKGMRYRSPS